MPKKLTILGALTVLVLGALGIFHSSGANAALPVQTFSNTGPNPIDYDICYGGAYPNGALACGVGSSDTYAGTPGATVNQYSLTSLPAGNRLTLPVGYTPTGASTGFRGVPLACGALDAFNQCTAGTIGGSVQARADILCDTTQDILATSSSTPGSWPRGNGGAGEWDGYPFTRIAANAANGGGGIPTVNPANDNSYVDVIRPFPVSFTFESQDRADLTALWLSGAALFPITSIPLQNAIYRMPASYPATQPIDASVALLGGNPGNPPTNDYTCLDSPQDSIANQQIILPTTPGDYVRWTVFTSAADFRNGEVARILDTQCVHVGPTNIAPVCDLSDADGDLVPAAVENILGSSPTNPDTDADGSSDYAEIFEFTNPVVADTDGDGSLDKHDNGADENVATVTTVDDTTADDNCPAVANPSQANTDSANDFTQTPALGFTDNTNPHQDTLGDACDTDDDNDSLTDVAEGNVTIMSHGSPATFCVGDATGVAPLVTISPTNADSDADLGLDGRECLFSSRPDDATSRFPAAAAGEDADADALFAPGFGATANGRAEKQLRTEKISISTGSQTDNPDGDGNTTGENDADSDNDGLRDGIEVKFYATDPTNADSDGDGCPDGKEAGDINGSRGVTSTDLGQIAARFGNYRAPNGTVVQAPTAANKQNYDYDKNGSISSTDLGLVAAQFGNCGVQLGKTVVNH